MLDALKYHVRHLADFTGRDSRQTFWYWFLFLFIINIAAGIAMSLPMMATGIAAAFEGARSGDPQAVQAAVITQMAGYMRPLMMGAVVLGVVNLVLMAAPLVRRLHDSGKSGLWAAVAGVIYLVSLWMSWRNADAAIALMREMAAAGSAAERMEAQAHIVWQNLLGYVPLVMVIVIGVLKSDPGANRFGQEPVRF
jgi:uncharacterized membrane protein YhaH (DUF805 family)